MATILLAFSGGVESTALLEKALTDGHKVVACMINVHGDNVKRLAEITACERIIKYYRDNSAPYQGKIVSVVHAPICPWVPAAMDTHPLAHNSITQQFATVLGMMSIRRYFMNNGMPTTWIGWIQEDTSDYSNYELDFSPKQYKQLLDLPKILGPLSNSDLSGCPFRAPFWDMSKADILKIIPTPVIDLLIPNASRTDTQTTITLHPYENKIKEWVEAGLYKVDEDLVPIIPNYDYSVEEASFEARYLSGLLLPKDLGLLDTKTNHTLLENISPFLSKGFSVVLDKDFSRIKSSLSNMLRVITDDEY